MFDDDIDFDESTCPECGHYPTLSRRCHVLGCEDGWIDMHEYDDPLWYDEGEEEICRECWGTGWERWCPKCGFDLQRPRPTKHAPDVVESAASSDISPASEVSASDGDSNPATTQVM